MGLSAEALEMRRNFDCASDTAQIMGVSPWGDGLRVYRSKVDGIDGEGNAATSAGDLLEEPTRKWFEMETGKRVIRPFRLQNNGFYIHPKDGLFAATLDGLVAGAAEIVEAKTTGVVGPGRNLDAWGENYSDEVPDQYMLQAQHQMYVMGETFKTVWMPVLIGTIGWRLYRIERHEGLINDIREAGHEFWEKHIIPKIPPAGKVEYDVLARMKRVPNKIVQVDPNLVVEWQASREQRLMAEKVEDAAAAALLNALGDAEGGVCDLGAVTYLEESRRKFDQKRLEAEKPDIFATYVGRSVHRTMRFKKAK